ncbi:MAG: hypothetical protein U0636_11790 [Phycisphaerales bacterium]
MVLPTAPPSVVVPALFSVSAKPPSMVPSRLAAPLPVLVSVAAAPSVTVL